jgi:hypothetical protein
MERDYRSVNLPDEAFEMTRRANGEEDRDVEALV